MSDDTRSCPSCGARVPAGADQCALCGTDVDDTPTGSEEVPPEDGAEAGHVDPTPQDAEDASSGSREAEERDHVYCNQCGFQNSVDANYCSRCGSELDDLPPAGASEKTRPVTADLPAGQGSSSGEGERTSSEGRGAVDSDAGSAAMGAQILWTVGVSVVVVLGFFFVTQWSAQYEWGEGQEDSSTPTTQSPSPEAANATSTGSANGPANEQSSTQPETDLQSLVDELSGPVDGPVAETIDSLRAVAEEAEGSRRREVQSELVQMYTGAGASGRAALVQSRLADATGSVDDRRRAADLLYQWMRQVEREQGRARVADVAHHVATAYESVVEQRTEDLDARTRMGEAYLLTNNPMKGIQAINGVLEADSTFVPARFQKGLALLQINRLDEAVQQFEMVKTHSDEQEPFYQQAERAIKVINEQRTSAGGADGREGQR